MPYIVSKAEILKEDVSQTKVSHNEWVRNITEKINSINKKEQVN
ncbi:MAG: hypothetical protein ABFS16_10575 [Bacteroidota bacterium]